MKNLAAAHGFARFYALPPVDLSQWREDATKAYVGVQLPYALPALFPWARSILLLVYAYAPYPPDCRIPAYYIASNHAYHAHKALAKQIAALGCRCEPIEPPLRALCLASGVGVQGKNGLLRIDPFGSRIVLFALLTDGCAPVPVTDAPSVPCPESCTACINACPPHAIHPHGLPVSQIVQEECMRYYMDDAPYPPIVYRLQQKHMGCEICMDACPFNACNAPVSPAAEISAAFALPRLASGDDTEARRLVGKNMTRHGKLTLEAQNFLSRQE
ncbi:MAG: 4Fe-4S double cluster binding domain-containing protein [Clostridia bacterium]|nr:4Fe-4S double cluster binding domain-containing protein [Clostridia bacterium]